MDVLLRISELVGIMYRSVFEPELFPVFLDGMAKELGGVGAIFVPLTPEDNVPSHVSSCLVEAVSEYRQHWWQRDPGFAFARNNGFPTGVLDGRRLINHDDPQNAPFYYDFAHRHDFSTFLSITMRPSAKLYLTLGVQRPIDSPPASIDEIRIANIFHGHFQSIIQLRQNSLNQRIMTALTESAERNRNGIAVVDPDFTVIFANQALKSFAPRGLLLRNATGKPKLITADPRLQGQLDRCIGQAFRRLDPDGIAARPGILSIPHSDRLPLLVSVAPLMADTSERLRLVPQFGISTLVTVVDPELRLAPAPFEAMQALGLTRAEAAVAVVVGRGHSPADAARELGLGRETVRTHLKSLFAKLQIKRQSQLSMQISHLSDLS
jgi:DNA-binding CsgD family transcriptional regulator